MEARTQERDVRAEWTKKKKGRYRREKDRLDVNRRGEADNKDRRGRGGRERRAGSREEEEGRGGKERRWTPKTVPALHTDEAESRWHRRFEAEWLTVPVTV